jgi:hypothetical protein
MSRILLIQPFFSILKKSLEFYCSELERGVVDGSAAPVVEV